MILNQKRHYFEQPINLVNFYKNTEERKKAWESEPK